MVLVILQELPSVIHKPMIATIGNAKRGCMELIFGGGESGDRSALSHFVNVRLPFLQVDNILHLRVICIPSVAHLKKVELILILLVI